MEKPQAPAHPAFTHDLDEVIAAERPYVLERRRNYGELRPEDSPARVEDLWGLAISGGGIRSATMGLGMIQKLIAEGLMRKFDYLSTVSGGGYIGSCLSSMMNNPPEAFVQPGRFFGRETTDPVPGMTPETSPFSLLMETSPVEAELPEVKARWIPSQLGPELTPPQQAAKRQTDPEQLALDYKRAEKTRLDARHQIHHLRTHGEYLTPNKGLFSPDVQRAVGAVLAGILHNLLMFSLALAVVVSLHYMILDAVSEGKFYESISQKNRPEQVLQGDAGQAVKERFGVLWMDNVGLFLSSIFRTLAERWTLAFTALALGLAVAMLFILSVGGQFRYYQELSRQVAEGKAEPPGLSGFALDYHVEQRFLMRFNLAAILGGPLLTLLIWLLGKAQGVFSGEDYQIIFSLPFCYSAGIFLTAFTVLPLIDHGAGLRRLERSLYSGLRGGAVYSLLFSSLMPVAVLVLFSFSFYFDDLFTSLFSGFSSVISILVGYLAMSQKDSGNPTINSYIRRLQPVILSLSVLLFVALAFSLIARQLSGTLEVWGMQVPVAMAVFWLSLAFFLLLGFFVNSNRLSLHYFYRDRLTETYLRTDGRVIRDEEAGQGMPVVNLRNDENLSLRNLGWRPVEEGEAPPQGAALRGQPGSKPWASYARGPYHLIVTALNLNGTSELVRKDLKSDHFIFSRDYIGSASTGYVRSDVYRGGKTKLARAMTISAAAVGSGMGFSTFFAQTFITTLLNLRLGYWMENPWYYRRNCCERYARSGWERLQLRLQGWKPAPGEAATAQGRRMILDPEHAYTFWPLYLGIEMLGLTTASRRLVNLSDGAHTGDNLGLIPLLRRRCKVIVVGDFEEDPTFAFISLNHAVRMANIEENVEIKIDLSPIIPEKVEKGAIHESRQSVVMGEIHYPDHSRGVIFYLKSSVSKPNFLDGRPRTLPVNVFNYYKLFSDFPHQTTADQFFDDPQFEAYRSLGFHIAEEAADKMLQHLRSGYLREAKERQGA